MQCGAIWNTVIGANRKLLILTGLEVTISVYPDREMGIYNTT